MATLPTAEASVTCATLKASRTLSSSRLPPTTSCSPLRSSTCIEQYRSAGQSFMSHWPLLSPLETSELARRDRLPALETLRDEMVDPVGVRCCPEAGFRRGAAGQIGSPRSTGIESRDQLACVGAHTCNRGLRVVDPASLRGDLAANESCGRADGLGNGRSSARRGPARGLRHTRRGAAASPVAG